MQNWHVFFLGIRRLQHILLKVSLLLGVEVFAPVKFEHVVPPESDVTGQGKAESTLFFSGFAYVAIIYIEIS